MSPSSFSIYGNAFLFPRLISKPFELIQIWIPRSFEWWKVLVIHGEGQGWLKGEWLGIFQGWFFKEIFKGIWEGGGKEEYLVPK